MNSKADPRFSHVSTDPRFKPIVIKEPNIPADDDRFAALREKSSINTLLDPRGRKFSIHKLGSAVKYPKKKKQLQDGDKEIEVESDGDTDDNEEEGDSDDKEVEDIEDAASEGNDESSTEQIYYDSDDESDNNDAIDGYVELDEDTELLKQMNKAMEENVLASFDCLSEDNQKRQVDQLLDPNLDIARGIDKFSDAEESSSDDSSSDEDEEEYNWGELDKDAQWDVDGHKVEETRRLAVCNIEWDVYKAQDILMVLSSFAPEGGRVLSVAVYLSEFGRQRMAEEERMGPKEVKDLPTVAEESDDHKDYESMRKYYFSRLKYYYAIAECSSVEVARVIYQAVDGHSFKNGGTLDLRYVPDDMTFDETPESECSHVANTYNSKKITDSFVASNFSRTKFTWDEDDSNRRKIIDTFMYNAEDAKNSPHLNELLASDSEDNISDDEVTAAEEFTSVYGSTTPRSKDDSIARFRRLIANIDTIDHAKEAEQKLLARVLGNKTEGKDKEMGAEEGEYHAEQEFSSDDEETEKEDNETEGLSVFEKYLEKRNKRQKEHRKTKKISTTSKKERNNDRDIPDDLKNDPFFKEELDRRRKEQLKKEAEERDAKNKELASQEKERAEREKELSLLMLDDDHTATGPSHCDMREQVRLAKQEAALGGGKKKLSRWKLAKLKAKQKRLAKEGVLVSEGVEEAKQKTVAATPLSVTPKDVVNDERFSGIFQNYRANLDPTHPEFSKHRTPFLDGVIQEIQHKNINEQKLKKRRLD